MADGVVVVRGPDWKWGNQDGGEGGTGIVTQTVRQKTKVGSLMRPAQTVIVQWADGSKEIYRAGARGAFDLRVFDNSNITGKHIDIVCNSCGVKSFKGMRWKCAQCVNCDLCSECYMSAKHLSHKFLRIASPGSTRVNVLKRSECYTVKVKRNAAVKTKLKFYYRENLPVLEIPCFEVGDEVQVKNDVEYVKSMQHGCPGWNDKIAETLGKVGTVIEILSNGNLRISISDEEWIYNAACVTKTVDCQTGTSEVSKSSVSPISREDRPHSSNSPTSLKATQYPKQSAPLVLEESPNLLPDKIDVNFRTNDGCTQLHLAAESSDLAVAKVLIENEADANIWNVKVPTALHVSVSHGYTEMVKLLLKHGRDVDMNFPDFSGNTALHLAVLKADVEILNILMNIPGADLRRLNNDGYNVLHLAVMQGNTLNHLAIVQALLKNKVNVNSVSRGRESALYLAIRRGNADIVKLLLESGSDVNIQDNLGNTALFCALHKNNQKIINLLIHLPEIDFNLKDNGDANVLHVAAMVGNVSVIEHVILNCQPDLVNAKTRDGHSPLHVASCNGHFDIARKLTTLGHCEIDSCDNKKQTPLLLAVRECHCSLVELLVSAGASVNVEDEDGNTCVHVLLMEQNTAKEMDLKDAPAIRTIFTEISWRNIQKSYNLAIACYLVLNGASLSHYNHRAETPLDLAPSSAVQVILQHYADKRKSQSQGFMFENCSILPLEMKQPESKCVVCEDVVAVVIFEPCGHQVTCEDCCFKMKKCILCKQIIVNKTDAEGGMISSKGPRVIIEQVKYLESKIQEIEEAHSCAICMDRSRNVAFSCGHGACATCSQNLFLCHLCRKPIEAKTNLYQ